MLTSIEDVLAWFKDYSDTNPYWTLYAGLDKADAGQRRGMNWETSDVLKSTELLKRTLERFVKMGGAYYLTISDKAKDNAPSGRINIMFGAANNDTATGVNGINNFPQSSYFDKQLQLERENSKLSFQLELEKFKAEQEKKQQGGINGWFNNLTTHPNFDPNIPFNIMGYFIGSLLGGNQMTPANVQGLPFHVEPPKVTPSHEPVEQPKKVESLTPVSDETKADFTYDVAKIAMDYHNFCESMGIDPTKRNNLLEAMNNNFSQLNPMQRAMLSKQLTGAMGQNTEGGANG